MDFRKIPLLVFDVLHPFEVADANAACVCQNVWEHGHATSLQRPIGLRRRRSVRRFQHHPGFDRSNVVGSNLTLERRRNQDVAVQRQQVRISDFFGAGRAVDRPGRGLVGRDAVQIEPFRGRAPPTVSLTATTLAPASANNRAAVAPALP